ncbi:nek kinase [Cryptosporidium felis]|nr:nek kinase [Cryptosporidium felis]
MKLTIPFLPRNSSFDFLYRNYRIIEYVGKGQFGNTYKVESTIDGKIWLAKCIDLSQMDEDDKKRSLQEAEIMRSVNNPFIIKCHESFIHDDVYLVIIMEFCEKGDIGALIDSCLSKGTYLPEKTILNWCAQLAAGLYYLHNDCKIIHRDIKPSNIFIRENGDVVIGDFGISRIMLSVTMPFTLTSIGTPQYMSPEMCENKPYTYKSDMWSFGCVLYELTNLKPPFLGDSLLSLAWNISFQEVEPLPKCFSGDLFVLIKRLLSRDPILRPDPIEVLKDKLLEEFRSSLYFLPAAISREIGIEKRQEGCGNSPKQFKSCDFQESFGVSPGRLQEREECTGSLEETWPNSKSSIEIRDIKDFSGSELTKDEKHSSGGKERVVICQRMSTNSISSSPSSDESSKTSLAEDCLSPRCGSIQVVFEGITNYENQYFSVLIGKIQHHILKFSERESLRSSEKDNLLNRLLLNLKCCREINPLANSVSSEWFLEFLRELEVGISQDELSILLSRFGNFFGRDPIKDSLSGSKEKKSKKSKIRHSKSYGSLHSLKDPKTTVNFGLGISPYQFGPAEPFEGEVENGLKFQAVKIYTFLEKITNLPGESTRLSRQEPSISSLSMSPVAVSEGSGVPNTMVRPSFYLFITDWIQTILKPVFALNNVTTCQYTSGKRVKNITLAQGFHLFDQKARGTLSRQHFRTVLYLILPKLTSVQLDWLYALAPKDFNGNVKYEQFLDFIENIQENGKERTFGPAGRSGKGAGMPIHSTTGSGPRREESSCFLAKEEGSRAIGSGISGEFLQTPRSAQTLDDSGAGREGRYENGLDLSSTGYSLQNAENLGRYTPLEERTGNEGELGPDEFDRNSQIQQSFYGFGIQDVVLFHYNSQTCMRPSPSPQLLARARSTALASGSRGGMFSEREKENQNSLNGANEERPDWKVAFKKKETSPSSPSPFDLAKRTWPWNGDFSAPKLLVESVSPELEVLIQNLQIERLFTCWITARTPDSNRDLFFEISEKLRLARMETSQTLERIISKLELLGEPKNGAVQSILELKSILLILEVELPLQRDAIDCILKIIDHVKLTSGGKEGCSKGILAEGHQESISSTPNVYKEIMKQAIANNMVLPIPKCKYNVNLPPKVVPHNSKAPDSKDFDWSGKFLASFEFFGETTVNLIQCGINILTDTKAIIEWQPGQRDPKNHSQISLLVENYRQWSYLKEHVSRECTFVASIGVNHDLKDDLQTTRIFLELLGARRFQVNVAWQQLNTNEKQLFRELFLLEESLWNRQKMHAQKPDLQASSSSCGTSDSELWLINGEQTCLALHQTCSRIIREIQSVI